MIKYHQIIKPTAAPKPLGIIDVLSVRNLIIGI